MARHEAVVLFLVALLVRVVFILAYGASAPPVSWGDDEGYHTIASRLVTEHKFISTYFPPGYSLFLAALYWVFGISWVIVRLIQAVLGAATCVLTYQLGKRLFSGREGLIAGWLLAFYPGHVYFNWRLMAETLYMCLLGIVLLLAVSLAERPRWKLAIVLGITLGYAQIVKSNLFPLPVLLIAWLVVLGQGMLRHRLLCSMAILAGVAFGFSITLVVNRLSVAARAVPLPSTVGLTLWLGNNPGANGYNTGGGEAAREFIEKRGFKERLETADAFERDRVYRTMALTWIRENPGQFALVCLKKLNNSFGFFPQAQIFGRTRRTALIHLASYGPIALLALVGLIASLRSWRTCSILYIVLLSYLPMVLIFYGTPRFTLLVIPVLTIFAAFGVTWLWQLRFKPKFVTGSS